MARHIYDGARARGFGEDRAKEIAWATVTKLGQKKSDAIGKAGEAFLPRPKTKNATPRENMSRMSYVNAPKKKQFFQRHRDGIKDLGTTTLTAKKAVELMSLEDAHAAMRKAAAAAEPTPAAALPPPKKFPRVAKPDPNAPAVKALSAGYGKTSGGGALKAPNREPMIIMDPNRELKSSCGCRGARGASCGCASKAVPGDAENVVHKSGGTPMAKTNFNDLFKSELGLSAEEVLIDCPHCEHSITKSDLAKGHGGAGKVTHISGAKHGKSSARVVDHNPEGGVSRDGTGHGHVKSNRGVPGAKKTDAPVGVQNDKGSRTRKSTAESDSASDDDSSSDDASSAAPAKPPMKKSIEVRGTEWVQWINDGSDAALAKAISEGGYGGTPPTQPLDLNNDLTRLLV
jgi:hypothetical protein